MPVYNGEAYLADAVKSILDQTFGDIEFVVVDDGSADCTSDILDRFRDSRIVRLRHTRNCGLVTALNHGLEVARGEWIARMDADDVSKRERLERQMAFLAAHPDTDVVGCRMEEIDSAGRPLRMFWAPEEHAVILWKLLFETAVAHATTVMRRSLLAKAGGYRADYRHAEDVELWSRLWGAARFGNLADPLYVRRWHPLSVSSTERRHQAAMVGSIRTGMWTRLLGQPTKPDWLLWLDERIWPILSRPQMNELMVVVMALYDAFRSTVSANASEAALLHEDVVDRMVRIAQRNGYVHPSALKHPWKQLVPGPLKAMVKRIKGAGNTLPLPQAEPQ
jgi:glycosyltransferase involved in cell wall biosynthesis